MACNADNQDRLPATYNGTNPFAYDSATGNTLNKGSISYNWDRLGNLRGVSQPYPGPSPTYLYDGQERKIARKTGSTYTHKWLYDGQLRIVAELNASNVVQKRFVYGSRDNVPDLMITSAGTYRLVTDQLGSVRRVINVSTGLPPSPSQDVAYDAWGKPLNTPGTFPTFGFAGGLYDAGTGMLHFGAREYDPTLGRWLSRDAARWGGGLNFCAYAADDPVNLIDPTGRYAVGGVVVVAAGSASAGAGPTGLALAAGGGAIVWAAWKILKAIDDYKHPTVGGYSPPAPDPGGNGPGGAGGPYRTPGQPPGPQYPECGGMAQRATEKCCRDKTGHRDDDEGTCPSSPETLQNFNNCMDENGW